MTSDKVYLKQNVLAEPLVNKWYAWSYLISPAPAAMLLANWHLRILQSFIAAPQVHVSALKSPAMIGGPFMNHSASRVKEVKALIEITLKEQAHMIEMAEAIKSLDNLLMIEAKGSSLEPLYDRIPDPLKGYAELVYDLNNQPSIRFIEGLLFKSQYYNEASQSIALSLINADDRSFVFSTPRLSDEKELHLNKPFSHEGVDELFKMKQAPQSFGYISEALGISPGDHELFSSFLTTDAPPAPPRYDGDSVRIRYFGHACILIESKDTNILFDPLISYKYPAETQRLTFADLPESIDYIFITHNHADHFAMETLLQLRHKTKNLVVPKSNGGALADPSLKLVLQHAGFRNVREIDEMESIEMDGGSVTGLPFLGEHTDLNVRTKLAYRVILKNKSLVIAADSNNIQDRLYEHIKRICGGIDTLFIGMECDGAPMSWVYGPLLTKPLNRRMDQSRRLNGSDYERGIRLVEHLNPRQVYVYAMGQEPWLTHVTAIKYTEESRPIVESNRLVTECRKRGISAERLYGQSEYIFD
jgi:L-ascorbate metabolism protein UlaG (beta-lactamase superfamily)